MNPSVGPVLRDIHLPPAPGWWPPAPGWWVVSALLVAVLIWLGYRRWSGRVRRQRWHQAQQELDTLVARHALAGDNAELAAGISQLLRRSARARRPDSASAQGEDWNRLLRQWAPDNATAQPLMQLDSVIYRPLVVIDAKALEQAARRWLRHVLLRGPLRA